MNRARFIGLGAVVVLAAHACYRPHLVDCLIACDTTGGCASGMTCSAGLCTRGPTCVLQIAAGARHACAERGGAVACWGNNAYGQLGIGSTANRGDDGSPIVFMKVDPERSTIAVAAGGRHTCAIVGTFSASTVLCWGDNSFGQLGVADGTSRGATPRDGFDAVPLSDGNAIAIAAGLTHTCALLDDARVVCWGDNRFGQLGVSQSPAANDGGVGGAAFAAVDLGGEKAKAVTAGAYHTCALLESGGVRCWGWNDYAQLGDPGLSSSVPGSIVSVNFPGGQRAAAIAAGAFHSCAVLETTGAVTCWGQNDAGQIGVAKSASQPVVAPGNLVALGKGRTAQQVAAGASHTCALLDDFSVKCWGFNADGELGIGDAANRGPDGNLGDALPRVGIGSDPVISLAAGANHTCVVQGASVKCWGFGDSGRLGVGDGSNRGDNPTLAIGTVNLASGPP